jgi:hypothetical protein
MPLLPDFTRQTRGYLWRTMLTPHVTEIKRGAPHGQSTPRAVAHTSAVAGIPAPKPPSRHGQSAVGSVPSVSASPVAPLTL